MKYVVILGDGMADFPIEELDNKTPLQYANIPNIDYLAEHGILGMVKTVPVGMAPGSDTANLSVMGYNPFEYYSGRSPFEAASMGVEMKDTDVTFRCNLVTLSEENEYEERYMLDHSADEISTEEARILIDSVIEHLSTEEIKFYAGISYRHLMVWDKGPYEWDLTPPHDIIGKKVKDFMPKGTKSEVIEEMMKKSTEFLNNHYINKARVEKGLRPANSLWIWGEGKKPLLSSFYDQYRIEGSVISAVDLIKGLGICAGLDSIEVEGATGNIHTNFIGKAQAALEELKNGKDFVYIHIEAPDECGHRNELDNKVKAIELIDNQVAKIVKEGLDLLGEEYKIMVLPDHPTPIALRTHTSDPVPFLIYENTNVKNKPSQKYDEFSAKETGVYIEEGYKLMNYFIKGTLEV